MTPADADIFNARPPIGTPVTVRRDDGSVLATRTRTAAWTLGDGRAVVCVEGISGGYDLGRVRAETALVGLGEGA